jgi:hypothetical protein
MYPQDMHSQIVAVVQETSHLNVIVRDSEAVGL